MASLLRGAPVAQALTEELACRVEMLTRDGVVPTLAIVRVGERPDDLSYERAALKRAEKVGVAVQCCALPASSSQADVIAVIEDINANKKVHGCLVFRPLPASIDEDAVAAVLHPAKDVDGMTAGSLFGVFAGRRVGYPPCTAEAALELIERSHIELAGANVCVIGRSLVIGKPVSLMLQARHATVTMCHTRTRDLPARCREADIIVVAAGVPRLLDGSCVRAGQTVIDVGINWDAAAGKLVGDVAFEEVEPVVANITPVPGGIGAVTTSILMKHVVEAAECAAHE